MRAEHEFRRPLRRRLIKVRRFPLDREVMPRRRNHDEYRTTEGELRAACAKFWGVYYESMCELHARRGRDAVAPIKDRNLGTTDAKHINVFEEFWRVQLATALHVKAAEVGPRTIRFRDHRSKSFDVCWPMSGEPKILISIKSMQNAYRNLTNRVEEAFGDSAVLRLYRSTHTVFGFFFFLLDGTVARGVAEPGRPGLGDAQSGRGKGVAPFLDLIEQGGDFFDLARVEEYRKPPSQRAPARQDVVAKAEQSLLDLVAPEPSRTSGIHYDAIAFAPTRIRRTKNGPKTKVGWTCEISTVDERLDFRFFISRLIAVAQLRGFL